MRSPHLRWGKGKLIPDKDFPGLTRRGLIRLGGALSCALLAPGVAAAAPWPSGRQGAVSLTYDDGLRSQLDNAAPQLDAHGFKATFFLTEDNMRGDLARWQALAAAGHEIGDHSVSHPCDLRRYDEARLLGQELEPMESYLDAHFPGPRFLSYAYPCDNTELGMGPKSEREGRYARLAARTFVAARTTDGPPNDPAHIQANRSFLTGFEPTEHVDTPELAKRYVRQAMARGHWAILIFHEVLPRWRGVGDCSAATHGRILDWIADQPVWCAPLGEVFQHLNPQAAAS